MDSGSSRTYSPLSVTGCWLMWVATIQIFGVEALLDVLLWPARSKKIFSRGRVATPVLITRRGRNIKFSSAGLKKGFLGPCEWRRRRYTTSMAERYLAFEDFEFDTQLRTLVRGGRAVPLSPRSLDILSLLIEHPGQVVTKETLMESLWPGDFVQESNLTQHVYLLRRALAAEGCDGLIRTDPRRGYRFVGAVVRRDAEAPSEAGSDARARHEGSTPPALRLPPFDVSRRAAIAIFAFVSLSIALAFGLGVRGERPHPVTAALNPQAERAYRLGRYYWNKRREADLRRSLVQFAIVMRLAPRSALGYSGAADARFQLWL